MRFGKTLTIAMAVIWLAFLAARPAHAESSTGVPGGLDYEAGLAKAAKENKFVLVDFYTPWCHSCREMEKTTFVDPEVASTLKSRVVPVKVDAGKRKDIAGKYMVIATPTIWLLDPAGAKIAQRTGYMSREELKVFLDYAITGAYKKQQFNDYVKSRR